MSPLISALLPVASEVLDRVIPDKNAREKAKLEMEARLIESANAVNLAQVETNQIEAQHRSVWVAGWRPAIGWACALGVSWSFILHPVVASLVQLAGHDPSLLPSVNTDILFELVIAMLGMSGLRTFEKLRKVTK